MWIHDQAYIAEWNVEALEQQTLRPISACINDQCASCDYCQSRLTAQTTSGCSSFDYFPIFMYLPPLILANIDSVHNVDIERGQRAADWRLSLRRSAFRTTCSIVLIAATPRLQDTLTGGKVCGGDKEQDESRSRERHDVGCAKSGGYDDEIL